MLFIDPEELQEETAERSEKLPSEFAVQGSQSPRTLRVLLTVARCGVAAILFLISFGVLSAIFGWGPLPAILAIVILWAIPTLVMTIWLLGAIWIAQRVKEKHTKTQAFLYSGLYGARR